MSAVVVRDVRPEEYDRTRDLLVDVYTAAGATAGYLEIVGDVAGRASLPRTESLIAVDSASGEILGACVFAYPGSEWAQLAREDEAEMRLLGVAEVARKRGVGAALVGECLARARLAGCSGLVLGTLESMRDAQRLYERLGFARTPDRDETLQSGRELLSYEKRIEPWPLIRPATPAEYDAVGGLTAAAYVDISDSYLKELRDAEGRAEKAELLVAVDRTDGTLLGTVTVCPDDSPLREIAHPDETEFRMLAVASLARRHGVGEALTRTVLARAKALGKRGVVMTSATWMPTAHRLYERLGFERDPERDWEPVPGVNLLAFSRDV